MAVLRADHVRKGRGERATAKANISYIQERPGRTKERLTRILFGPSGPMGRAEAYQLINEAPRGTYFYRLKLSPDPQREDTKRDLSMEQLTRQMMHGLEGRLNTTLAWAGALHDDHTPIRHVHILAALPKRLNEQELMFLIREATRLSREQRRSLDRSFPRHLFSRQAGRSPLLTLRRPTGRRAVAGTHKPRRLVGGRRSIRRLVACICPHCHFPQLHNHLSGIHQCFSCGLLLHKKKALGLRLRKGRGWERSL